MKAKRVLKSQETGSSKPDKTLRQKAEQFCKYWRNNNESENSAYQNYWRMLLHDVFGIEQPESRIRFQVNVKIKGRRKPKTLDAWIPETKVLIEHKSRDKKLDAPQPDHEGKTPYEQAKEYDDNRPYEEKARWIITCNFDEIWVYDCKDLTKDPEKNKLVDLPKEIHRFSFLVDKTIDEMREKEKNLSFNAGKIIGDFYKKLKEKYDDPKNPETLKMLNRLCVRLVFILYAEDSYIFPKDGFWKLIKNKPSQELRRWILTLFTILNIPENERDPYLEPELKNFPYTNGGLFNDISDKEIPPIDDEIKELLVNLSNFDWHNINPTIFGAIFESTLDPITRRKGGMVYTSVENIHRVIDPLFLNDLKNELESIKSEQNILKRRRMAKVFQEKLGSLTFLDPACGSGNFLTETYISLRRLENEAIRIREEMLSGQGQLNLGDLIKVSINQFYGIEINDFAVSVAKTALWIAEAKMLFETAEILNKPDPEYLPLRDYNGIKEDNALRISWPKTDYIMGNPPFIGARNKKPEQAKDMALVFGDKWRGYGDLDYVTAWYKKAVELEAPCAFVSTNSICQGDISVLWKPLFEKFGVEIDFCWRTFCWNSEATEKSHVHVIIIGFHSGAPTNYEKKIYDDSLVINAKHINAYLMDFSDVWIESRTMPLCSEMPKMSIGNKPIDDGNYLFTYEEKKLFLKKEPGASKFFRPFYGADDFLNKQPRWCLWLGDCSNHELHKMPECLKRVEAVRDYRKNSDSKETKKLMDKPTRFHVEHMPSENYLLLPRHSSEKRVYIPIGFMSPEVLTGDSALIIPEATLYHFGVLSSSVHMAWMRTVAGRLETRYRYSAQIVYNNFPWPNIKSSSPLFKKISDTAKAILDARNNHPDSSFVELYDEMMPEDLRAAHNANDKAVLEAYGISPNAPESTIVENLFNLYLKMTREK